MTPQPAPVAQAIESLVSAVPSAERLAQLATNRCIAQQWPLHGREWVFNEDGLRKFAEAIVSDVPAVSPQGWQPIETAPKDGAEMLLYHPDVYNKRDGHRTLWALRRVGRPHDWPNRPATHWMHLPPPPKGEQL